MPTNGKGCTRVLSRLQVISWAANLIRYRIIERYGGVYLDNDVVPLRSLESLRKLGTFTVCESPRVRPPQFNPPRLIMTGNVCLIACNAVIAATKGHPALAHVIEVSMDNTLQHLQNNFLHYSTSISGPTVWTKSAKMHAFNILYAATFYPCNWDKREKCIKSRFVNDSYVYGMHNWEHSWREQPPARLNKRVRAQINASNDTTNLY
jgi:hypothetical protein